MKTRQRSSTADTDNKYIGGYKFWSENAFWRTSLYRPRVQAQFEAWLKDLQKTDKRIYASTGSI